MRRKYRAYIFYRSGQVIEYGEVEAENEDEAEAVVMDNTTRDHTTIDHIHIC